MRLSEIQNKDVINMAGNKLGNIIDVTIDEKNGKIDSFILEKRKFTSVFSNNSEIQIKYESIKKIGEDVILVETFKL